MENRIYHYCHEAVIRQFKPYKWPSSALDRDDLIQETAVAVQEKMQAENLVVIGIDDVLKIARNVITKFYRREKRRSFAHSENFDKLDPAPSPEAHIFGSMNLCVETAGHAGRALFNQLNARDERILWYYLTDGGCDARATASHCKLTPKVVYDAVSSAYRLADELHFGWFESQIKTVALTAYDATPTWQDHKCALIDLARSSTERAIARLFATLASLFCSLNDPSTLDVSLPLLNRSRGEFDSIPVAYCSDPLFKTLHETAAFQLNFLSKLSDGHPPEDAVASMLPFSDALVRYFVMFNSNRTFLEFFCFHSSRISLAMLPAVLESLPPTGSK